MPSSSKYPMADAVRAAYRAGEEDEAMEPRILVNGDGMPLGRIADGDHCIFYDIRGEREIELTQAFTQPGFAHFPIAPIRTHWATMIQYSPKLDVRVAFPPAGAVDETLSETIARAGRRQVKITESEKAVHVSFFLNGKHDEPFPGEDREVIPSPKDVANYDACPEMAARDVADAAIRALKAGNHDFLFVNFANVDVVGHIENRDAILKAVETVDAEAGRVVDAAREAGVTVLITADHGTVEKWYYPEGTVDTGHTNSPVPFVLIDRAVEGRKDGRLHKGGALTDVAPTVLELMGLEKPAAMTGRSLLAAALPPARRRVLVILLDGWGVGDGGKGDLIHAARTPRMDEFLARYPSTVLAASGSAVGMPDGTVGNSECGHLHLGAGRVIPTDRVRIEQAIQNGSFRRNEAFRWAMEGAKRDAMRLHLVGIISFYSSHGSVEHLLELVRMAHDIGVREVYIHGMLGRRGERPESGAVYTETVEKECARLGTGRFVTLIGRFWSLDREENWDRIEKTYRALVEGRGEAVRAVN
ncbi:MAG TPA: alkaline phosphatase family protein [Phycisphaerae bacterium]|nr:alkaline phosphatase family protein [Phycisphaerae bacterium]